MKNNKLKQDLKEIESEKKDWFKLFKLKSEFCREYYLQLINTGFSEDEALELCKSTFTTEG